MLGRFGLPARCFSWGRRLAAFACAAAVLLFFVRPARGDLQLDGRWRQSALREEFTVQTWMNACGPSPQNSSTGGGEIVTIRMEGDELAILGGGRVYRSNQCYDPMPGLTRESHSRDPSGRSWRTRCTTPANDSRSAILNTLVIVTTDTQIDVVETGRYTINQESGRCMADVKRTRTYTLVGEDKPTTSSSAAPPPPPTPTEKPDPKPAACGSVGDPSRLEVRPSKKLLKTGETFSFRALVLDDKGCATKTPTTWKLAPGVDGKGIAVDNTGKVTVAADAPEGTVELVVTAAGKDARVTLQVTSPSHYDDLLRESGLNSSGENDTASVTTLGTQSIGAGQGTVEDRSKSRRMIFLAVVAGVLVVLSIVAIVLMRRSRRAKALEREAEERHEARVSETLERRRTKEAEHAAQLRAHEESLVAAREAEKAAEERAAHQRAIAEKRAAAAAAAAADPRVERLACPSCGREFDAPQAFCPHDGGKLAPAKAKHGMTVPIQAVVAKAAPTKRGKICPTCGDRFDGNADFCGKDGTQLVLLN
jgi:hypothetical protein